MRKRLTEAELEPTDAEVWEYAIDVICAGLVPPNLRSAVNDFLDALRDDLRAKKMEAERER